ncbi:MAG: alpha/beta hydrolase [Synechococcus sp.]|nr:alpha/beta hydrolase [Synechococcus sp.]
MSNRKLLESRKSTLLDPQAKELMDSLQWWEVFKPVHDHYPVVQQGQGPIVLMLHGFDSSHLEFRRLAPLLSQDHTLVIPDLYGFGFCPRHPEAQVGPGWVMEHLTALLDTLPADQPIGVIGASMGGAVAMELARRHPDRIERLLLLSPAGLDGQPMPLPPLLDQLGVWFLGRPAVRRGLCRQAFADPDNSVDEPELQIASLHLQVPGWARSLAAFARSGGFAGCGSPLPSQPLRVLWGKQDRILRQPQKRAAQTLLGARLEEVDQCGHLPHLDQPELVAQRWRAMEAAR